MSNRPVQAIRINGDITKEVLIELGSNPELEGFIVACKWKGEGYSVGWSNMDDRELAYGALLMDNEIKKDLLGDQ